MNTGGVNMIGGVIAFTVLLMSIVGMGVSMIYMPLK